MGAAALCRSDRGEPPAPGGHGHAEDNTFGLPEGEGLAAELLRWFAEQQKWVLDHAPKDPLAPVPAAVPALTDWTDPMAAACVPYLSATWDDSGKAVMGRLGLDPGRFDVTSPELRNAVRKQAYDFCAATNATTTLRIDRALARLHRELHEGVVGQGESLDLLTDRVKAVFDLASEGRARRIAATESARAYHAAQEAAGAGSGVVAGFELLLSSDACPLCRKVHDEARRVRLGQAFAVIGSNPTYSEIRHPPIHPACQCSMNEVLAPEYGGPADPEWFPTLVRPAAGGPAPPKPKPEPKPKPKPRPKPEPVVSPPPPAAPPVPYTRADLPELAEHRKYVREEHDAALARLAGELGTTPGALREEITSKIRAAVGHGEFYLRVDSGTLPKVLEAGRFKTQFEVKTSLGSYDPESRSKAEAELFGTPPDVDPSKRPVYGYMARPDFGSARTNAERSVDTYGDVIVRLKPGVRSRATVTVGDSLSFHDQLQGVPASAPTADAFPVPGGRFGPIYERFVRPEADPGKLLDTLNARFGYLEAQHHGGLGLEDVAEMAFIGPPPSRVREALESRGIPWRVIRDRSNDEDD